MPAPEAKQNDSARLAAWGVHLFTATSAVLALLALLAVERRAWTEVWLWLGAALVVDGVDGTLARAARVRERLPRIDGEALDLVVDYLTYVFVPVLFIWHAQYLPAAWALPLCAAILVSSLYVFARRDMKTDDGYFRGFPALWNVIAFYFFVALPEPAVAAVVVGGLVIITFAPVHVVHPFRVRDYGAVLPALAILWAGSTLALLLGSESPMKAIALAISLISAAALILLGLWRTLRGPRTRAQ